MFVLENYPGTILVDTPPRSEAWSPTQQHAQVAATITMGALSHAPDADVKSGAAGHRDRKQTDLSITRSTIGSIQSVANDATSPRDEQ